ncbi:MAG: GTP-binding protein [Acetobacteraceae bacterium]
MRLKLFRAATTVEAMARIRTELGDDALILGSRRVDGGVELTAALEVPEPPPSPPPVDPARQELLTYHAIPSGLHSVLEQGALDSALSRALSFTNLPLAPGEQPLLLTGPPGAGKTLTAARLATRLVLGGGSPMIVTADGKRAGAAEQLAAFTKLLGLTLVAASHPVTLSRALTRRQDCAPVLIDAPGIDPFDAAQADELRAMATSANAAVALVLPAGLDPAEAADLAVAFAETGASLLIVTRLDLVRRLGGLFAAATAARLPLTEGGIGPGAADGMTPLTPQALAARLMQTGKPLHDRHAA